MHETTIDEGHAAKEVAVHYAGFWIRVAALFLDSLFLIGTSLLIFQPLRCARLFQRPFSCCGLARDRVRLFVRMSADLVERPDTGQNGLRHSRRQDRTGRSPNAVLRASGAARGPRQNALCHPLWPRLFVGWLDEAKARLARPDRQYIRRLGASIFLKVVRSLAYSKKDSLLGRRNNIS